MSVERECKKKGGVVWGHLCGIKSFLLAKLPGDFYNYKYDWSIKQKQNHQVACYHLPRRGRRKLLEGTLLKKIKKNKKYKLTDIFLF